MTSSMLADMTLSAGPGAMDVGVARAYEKLIGNRDGPAHASLPIPTSSAPPQEMMGANPYMEGRSMGRGAHMTKPSWSLETDKEAHAPSDSGRSSSVVTVKGQFSDCHESQPNARNDAPVIKKRKNRFAGLFSDPTSGVDASESRPPAEAVRQTVPPVPTSTPLPGFVRASGSSGGLTSVSQPSQRSEDNECTKKSRWH